MRLVGVMLACAAVLAAQTVEGTVVNPVTKAGVADVDVRLLGKADNNYAALTDAQGYFRFDNVADGSYSLDCGKEGFDAYRANSPVVVKTGADAVKLQVQLRPLGKIGGRVVDGKGRPVADARLTLAASPRSEEHTS